MIFWYNILKSEKKFKLLEMAFLSKSSIINCFILYLTSLVFANKNLFL